MKGDAGLSPRLITSSQLAAYLGYRSDAIITKLRKSGVIPAPIGGINRYDIKAVDLALDRASGLRED